MAAAILVAVLVGFAPSFYLRAWFDAGPEAPRVWLHGIILTAWFVLFWLQAEWVARGQIAWHRRVGWLGAAIALAAVVTTLHVTLVGAALIAIRVTAVFIVAGSTFGQIVPGWFA